MKFVTHQAQLIDHRLAFDPEAPSSALATSTPQPALLMPRTLPAIPWPAGEAPKPQPIAPPPSPESPLPRADVLVVTWTVAEALALSDVLTPGYRSKKAWYHYRHNWEREFRPLVRTGAPSLEEDRLGLWFTTRIAGKSVVCMKSELHFARDGGKIPLLKLWRQIIEESKPSLVITTGTAGAIGGELVLGDVVVSRKVRFDCRREFASSPFSHREIVCPTDVPLGKVSYATSKLLGVTLDRLPHQKRHPRIVVRPLRSAEVMDVVTTDFFAFDDTTDHFGLQGLGSAVEMDDAVLGLACTDLGSAAPAWVAVRNASDPQIDGSLPLNRQAEVASRIYEKYGYWTTVNSAIATWAVIAS